MDRDWSEGVPRWLPLASWGFWLTVAAGAAAVVLQAVAAHRAEAAAGARDWHLRVEICKRLSQSPRPPWWECHSRANEDGDLLAPSTPGGPTHDGRAGRIRRTGRGRPSAPRAAG